MFELKEVKKFDKNLFKLYTFENLTDEILGEDKVAFQVTTYSTVFVACVTKHLVA